MGIDSPAKSTTSQKWPDKPFVESKQRRSIVDEPSNVNEDKEQWRPKTYTLIPKLLSRPSFSYFSPCESTDENGNTYPEGGAQAWLVVLGSLCSMFSGFGVVNSIGVINAYITDHQLKHYSDSDISWVFSFYIFLVFFCGLQIGPIFDARGPRELILAGSICMVLSCFLLGICEGIQPPISYSSHLINQTMNRILALHPHPLASRRSRRLPPLHSRCVRHFPLVLPPKRCSDRRRRMWRLIRGRRLPPSPRISLP